MNLIYNFLAEYHRRLSLWFRKQVIICNNCSNYWSLKARGLIEKDNGKTKDRK